MSEPRASWARSILFISPSFFGYERDIARAFEEHGARVRFVDERPSNGSLGRAVLRVAPRVLASRVRRYYEKVAEDLVGQSFDLILVVKGETMPRWFLQHLRATYRDAVFAFYTFDSVVNTSRWLEMRDLFDVCLSFDSGDVKRDPGLTYLPLFYGPEFSTGGPLADRRYDASFVGTLHSDRQNFVPTVLRSFDASRVFSFFYVQARWYYYLRKLLRRGADNVTRADISFSKIPRNEVARIFASSKVVVDAQRDGQTGLTMRTFEVLAVGSLLITTNKAITETDFYSPDRVLVLDSVGDRSVTDQVLAFASAARQDGQPPDGFERYSIANWVQHFLALQR